MKIKNKKFKFQNIRGCYCVLCNKFIPIGEEIHIKHYGRVCFKCSRKKHIKNLKRY